MEKPAPSVVTDVSDTLTNSTGSPFSARSETSRASIATSPSSIRTLFNRRSERRAQPTLSILEDAANHDEEDIKGWPKVAALMATYPEFEAFSRFRKLNIKMLLYYQVEIAKLENELRIQEKGDRRRPICQEYATYAHEMIDNDEDTEENANAKERQQWKLIRRIRRRLQEYNAAIIQHAQISAIPGPDCENMEAFCQWVREADGGNYCIGGYGVDAWGGIFKEDKGKPAKHLFSNLLCAIFPCSSILDLVFPRRRSSTQPSPLDLVAPHSRPKTVTVDGFTRWITRIVHAWVQLTGKRINPAFCLPTTKAKKDKTKDREPYTLEKISESFITKGTRLVSMVVACLLPILAIWILTTTEKLTHKLLYITGFTPTFALAILIFTGTTNLQMFTATAAFTAVLVVFVQEG